MKISPEYSPKVELGHIIQGGLLFLAILSFVLTTVFAVAPAWTAMSARQAELDARTSALTAAMGAMEAAINLRVTADENRMDRSDQEHRDFETEQRAAITKVLDAVNDLRDSGYPLRHR